MSVTEAPASSFLIEAHFYSGGLRYASYPLNERRPSWAPPPEAVGLRDRDDLSLSEGDWLIEFNQRLQDECVVSWMAVYRRSVDAELRDRGNHAGVGVWLRGARIGDARALLRGIAQLAATLAQSTDPEVIADPVNTLSQPGYLDTYLVDSNLLPAGWTGAPATASQLPETRVYKIAADDFESSVAALAEQITRLSISWNPSGLPPRTLLLLSVRPDVAPAAEPLPAPGPLLAEIIERIPADFQESNRAVQELKNRLDDFAASAEEERRRASMLDGLPPSLEGIARRLNVIDSSIQELKNISRNRSNTSLYGPSEQFRSRSTASSSRGPVQTNYKSHSERQTSYDTALVPTWALLLVVFVVILGLFLVWYFSRSSTSLEYMP